MTQTVKGKVTVPTRDGGRITVYTDGVIAVRDPHGTTIHTKLDALQAIQVSAALTELTAEMMEANTARVVAESEAALAAVQKGRTDGSGTT